MALNYRPIANRVVLSQLKLASKSLIALPDGHEADMIQCEVVAVGPGHLLQSGAYAPCQVVVGERVDVPRLNCDEIEIDDTKYLITTDVKITGAYIKVPFSE